MLRAALLNHPGKSCMQTLAWHLAGDAQLLHQVAFQTISSIHRVDSPGPGFTRNGKLVKPTSHRAKRAKLAGQDLQKTSEDLVDMASALEAIMTLSRMMSVLLSTPVTQFQLAHNSKNSARNSAKSKATASSSVARVANYLCLLQGMLLAGIQKFGSPADIARAQRLCGPTLQSLRKDTAREAVRDGETDESITDTRVRSPPIPCKAIASYHVHSACVPKDPVKMPASTLTPKGSCAFSRHQEFKLFCDDLMQHLQQSSQSHQMSNSRWLRG